MPTKYNSRKVIKIFADKRQNHKQQDHLTPKLKLKFTKLTLITPLNYNASNLTWT